MNKIPTLFKRDENNRKYVTDEVNPECQWVLDGEGVATRKYDGTCMMLDSDGVWWQRRELKKDRPIPEVFKELNYDEVTGKRIGWVPMDPKGYFHPFLEALGVNTKEDWTRITEAIAQATNDYLYEPGTYELIGPKINGNPEGAEKHHLINHMTQTKGFSEASDSDRSIEGIKNLIRRYHERDNVEGIVWHHPDGRMAKLKARDIPNV